MPDHWTSLRQHNEQQRHHAATRSLRDHPFAIRPDERERLEAAGLIIPRGHVIHFTTPATPAEAGVIRAAALEYLKEPRPQGYAKAYAAEHGLNYGSLLTGIGKIRAERLPS